MATSRSLRAFARRLGQIKQEFLTTSEQTITKTAGRALQVAVFATRVKLGRARGGWVINLGTSTKEAGGGQERDARGRFRRGTQGNDKEGTRTIAKGQQEAARFRITDGSITLFNNVEYILFLDRGSPTNEPDNMVAQAVQAAEAFIREAQFI